MRGIVEVLAGYCAADGLGRQRSCWPIISTESSATQGMAASLGGLSTERLGWGEAGAWRRWARPSRGRVGPGLTCAKGSGCEVTIPSLAETEGVGPETSLGRICHQEGRSLCLSPLKSAWTAQMCPTAPHDSGGWPSLGQEACGFERCLARDLRSNRPKTCPGNRGTGPWSYGTVGKGGRKSTFGICLVPRSGERRPDAWPKSLSWPARSLSWAGVSRDGA